MTVQTIGNRNVLAVIIIRFNIKWGQTITFTLIFPVVFFAWLDTSLHRYAV